MPYVAAIIRYLKQKECCQRWNSDLKEKKREEEESRELYNTILQYQAGTRTQKTK